MADRQAWVSAFLPAKFAREVAVAVPIGVLLMLPVVATMLLFDMRELKPGIAFGIADFLELALVGVGTGLVVALIEETFLRGAMQTAITRESGTAIAIALTSILYSAFHFVAGK